MRHTLGIGAAWAFALCTSGALAQETEAAWRERAALRIAAGDQAGAVEIADRLAGSTIAAAAEVGAILRAELLFRFDRREEAFAVLAELRKKQRKPRSAGLASGDLIEFLSDGALVERGAVTQSGNLACITEIAGTPVLGEKPEALSAAVHSALQQRFGKPVQIRAWRSKSESLGVSPAGQEPTVEQEALRAQVLEHLTHHNLRSSNERSAQALAALRRMGTSAVDIALDLWLAEEAVPPARSSAAYYVAMEDAARFHGVLKTLPEGRNSGAALWMLRAMEDLKGLPPALVNDSYREAWLGVLGSPNAEVRDRALGLLDSAFPQAIAERLAQLLQDPDPIVRQRVMQQVLPRLAWDDTVLQLVRERLQDDDAAVRYHAVILLGQRNVLSAADALRVLREDSHVETREQCLKLARGISGTARELEELIVQGFLDPSTKVQDQALGALAQRVVDPIEDQRIADFILVRSNASDEQRRMQAMYVISCLNDRLIGPTVEEILQKVALSTFFKGGSITIWPQERLRNSPIRPRIWLERRPWVQREADGFLRAYDDILKAVVIPRLEREDLPAWLELLEVPGFAPALLARAASVDIDLLKGALLAPSTSSRTAYDILSAIRDDERVIDWIRGDSRWSDDATVMNYLRAFRHNAGARELFSNWIHRATDDLGRRDEKLGVLRNWAKACAGDSDGWLIPILVRKLMEGEELNHDVQKYFGNELIQDAALAEVERQWPTLEGRPPIGISHLIRHMSGYSLKVREFWARELAPLCEESSESLEANGMQFNYISPMSPEVLDLLLSWSHSNRVWLRKQAAYSLQFDGGARTRTSLLALLRDEDASIRKTAASNLGGFPDLEVVDALTAATMDASTEVRAAANVALGRLRTKFEAQRFWSEIRADGGEDPLAKILPLLRDEDPEVRTLAIDSLGAMGSPRALPQLLELFKSGKEPEKSAARRAIQRIQSAVDAERAKATPPAPAEQAKEESKE